MEELKAIEKILEPDERIGYFVGFSLEYLHGRAAGITINATAPENVHNQFTIARGALVYAFFFYPFFPVALLYSFLAIEAALNERAKKARPDLYKGGREPTMYPLLEIALKERWITDAGFSSERPGEPRVPEHIAARYPAIPSDQRYSYSPLDSLVSLRNSLTHGDYMLMPTMAPLLDRGAETINQLFPKSASKAE